MRPLKVRSTVAGHQKLTTTNWEAHWSGSLTTTWEVAKELSVYHSMVIRHLKQVEEVPKAKIAPKSNHGHCLVVHCPSDPLQNSEFQWNHYIWEVSSANRWDAPKTATPTASSGQQKGPNFSPQHHATICHTTNASNVEWIGLWSFVSSTIFTWPLTNWLPLLQASDNFLQEKHLHN